MSKRKQLRDLMRAQARREYCERQEKYLSRQAFGGYHLDREALMAEAVKIGRRYHIRVCGPCGRPHADDGNTPDLDAQREALYRINPTGVYGGWQRRQYAVTKRR